LLKDFEVVTAGNVVVLEGQKLLQDSLILQEVWVENTPLSGRGWDAFLLLFMAVQVLIH
jgi:hypothetical protein